MTPTAVLKPTISAMKGDRDGRITPSSMAQSIEIQGTGFAQGMELIDVGPDPADREHSVRGQVAGPIPNKQVLQVQSPTLALAVLSYPEGTNGPHRALLIVGGQVSEWFSYSVG